MGIEVGVGLEFVEMVVLWWVLVLLKSQMAWEVSVMGVMNIISSISELVRVVESIELISRSLDVVLNTIAIVVSVYTIQRSIPIRVCIDKDRLV